MRNARDPLVLASLAGLGVGSLALVLFDVWFTRLLGVLALFVFIISGVFAIASPAFLADDEEEGGA